MKLNAATFFSTCLGLLDGFKNSAIELIDQLINNGNDEISVLLMKLKLSLSIKTPIELAHQIDEILKNIDNNEN